MAGSGVRSVKEKNREQYLKNREKRLAQARDQRIADPIRNQLYQAKARARKRGVPFSITRAHLEPMPLKCPVLGLTLDYTMQSGQGVKLDTRATIDCHKPALGYVPGNVYVISWRANKIKCNASADELLHVAHYAVHGVC